MTNELKLKFDNEVWQDVLGYEGLYQVSNFGRIKTLKRQWKNQYGYFGVKKEAIKAQKLSAYNKDKKQTTGYYVVNLCKDNDAKWVRVHRLVAEAFIPNPQNKPEVNHINGIKTDNRVDNLEWVSHQENALHCWKTGLREKGEKERREKISKSQRTLDHLKKITKETILDIYNNCILGSKNKNAHIFAKKHNINLQTVCNIKNLANPIYRDVVAGIL